MQTRTVIFSALGNLQRSCSTEEQGNFWGVFLLINVEEGETGKETRSSDGDKCYKTMQDNVVGNEGGAVGKRVEPMLEVLS